MNWVEELAMKEDLLIAELGQEEFLRRIGKIRDENTSVLWRGKKLRGAYKHAVGSLWNEITK